MVYGQSVNPFQSSNQTTEKPTDEKKTEVYFGSKGWYTYEKETGVLTTPEGHKFSTAFPEEMIEQLEGKKHFYYKPTSPSLLSPTSPKETKQETEIKKPSLPESEVKKPSLPESEVKKQLENLKVMKYEDYLKQGIKPWETVKPLGWEKTGEKTIGNITASFQSTPSEASIIYKLNLEDEATKKKLESDITKQLKESGFEVKVEGNKILGTMKPGEGYEFKEEKFEKVFEVKADIMKPTYVEIRENEEKIKQEIENIKELMKNPATAFATSWSYGTLNLLAHKTNVPLFLYPLFGMSQEEALKEMAKMKIEYKEQPLNIVADVGKSTLTGISWVVLPSVVSKGMTTLSATHPTLAKGLSLISTGVGVAGMTAYASEPYIKEGDIKGSLGRVSRILIATPFVIASAQYGREQALKEMKIPQNVRLVLEREKIAIKDETIKPGTKEAIEIRGKYYGEVEGKTVEVGSFKLKGVGIIQEATEDKAVAKFVGKPEITIKPEYRNFFKVEDKNVAGIVASRNIGGKWSIDYGVIGEYRETVKPIFTHDLSGSRISSIEVSREGGKVTGFMGISREIATETPTEPKPEKIFGKDVYYDLARYFREVSISSDKIANVGETKFIRIAGGKIPTSLPKPETPSVSSNLEETIGENLKYILGEVETLKPPSISTGILKSQETSITPKIEGNKVITQPATPTVEVKAETKEIVKTESKIGVESLKVPEIKLQPIPKEIETEKEITKTKIETKPIEAKITETPISIRIQETIKENIQTPITIQIPKTEEVEFPIFKLVKTPTTTIKIPKIETPSLIPPTFGLLTPPPRKTAPSSSGIQAIPIPKVSTSRKSKEVFHYPYADLISVAISQARYGKATTPKLSKEQIEEFRKQFYVKVPTKELLQSTNSNNTTQTLTKKIKKLL
ncbi:MAG: hypothetical protein QXG39_04110 [Candidatus Aenigmatarchaeota archaeon]